VFLGRPYVLLPQPQTHDAVRIVRAQGSPFRDALLSIPSRSEWGDPKETKTGGYSPTVVLVDHYRKPPNEGTAPGSWRLVRKSTVILQLRFPLKPERRVRRHSPPTGHAGWTASLKAPWRPVAKKNYSTILFLCPEKRAGEQHAIAHRRVSSRRCRQERGAPAGPSWPLPAARGTSRGRRARASALIAVSAACSIVRSASRAAGNSAAIRDFCTGPARTVPSVGFQLTISNVPPIILRQGSFRLEV